MSSTNTLNDVQLAELRKAFAVFDQDGNGRIDLNEMKQLLSSLLGKNASDDEAAQIMKLVDNDNSGDVDFDEFAKVMENWLASDFKSDETGATTNELSSPTTRKRKKAGNDERHDLHKRVRSFFTQFHPVAATASDALESVRGGMRTDEHSLVNNSMMRDVEAYTSAAKLDFLLKFRATMTNFANLVSGLRKALETGVVVASKEAEATEITRCIAQCLSVCDVFPTPAERRGVADDIVQLFELIVQLNLVPLLAKGLKVPSNDVAAASARCLGTIANGPRIASTPVDSLLHPSQMFFKKLVISEGVVPLLITMLSSHVADVRDEALLALAAIAEHDPTARDFVLAARALPPILNLIQAASPLTTVRKAVFATAVLCGVTHPMSRLPPWPEVQPSLERVALALFCDDDETIATACRALAILLPGCTELSYDRRLVQLMATENAKVAAAVLSTIQSIVTYDDQQTQVLLRCSLLTGLRACLKNADAHVRLSAVEVCSTLVGAKGQVQVLIDAKLVPMLLTLLKVDSSVRFRVATLVKYLSRGTPRQVGYLAEQEAVAACCGVLSHFKVYDPVLIKAYGYVGPSFNFEFVHDLLAALDNIVNVGAVAAADAGRRINDNALHFDLEAIDKLRQMLATIRDAGPTVVAAWRQERGDSEPIEHVCGRLLLKVRAAHQHAMSQQNNSNPASAAVAAMVDAVLNEFYQSPEATAAEKVLLKCQLGDDIRVVEVFRDVSYDDLKLGMSQKWGTTPERLQLKYSDADGDQVVIDGQGAWHKALEEHAASGNASLRLYAALAADTVTGFQSLQSPVLARRSVANATNSNNETRLDASAILKSSSFNVQPENPAGAAAFKLDFTAARSDELSSLVANTRFTTAEIESLRSTWASQSSNGTVGREAFAQGLAALGVTDPLVIEQNFSLFDRDNNGEIDFREFVTGLSVLQRGTTDEKLRLLFDAYDLDSNGQLDRDELYQIYKASLSFSGKQQFKTPAEQHQAITQMVEQCFALVDDNKDGVLQFEEFKKAVESQAIVLESLIHVPISIV